MHRFLRANLDGGTFPYARLVVLMKQIGSSSRKWSVQLGRGLCMRRIGQKRTGLTGYLPLIESGCTCNLQREKMEQRNEHTRGGDGV
ncbi:unnamed protein product [Discosporangium mesarthrocarpum]